MPSVLGLLAAEPLPSGTGTSPVPLVSHLADPVPGALAWSAQQAAVTPAAPQPYSQPAEIGCSPVWADPLLLQRREGPISGFYGGREEKG